MKICPACSREFGDEHEACLDDGVPLIRLDTGANVRGQDLIGKVIDGRYRVERIVGRGGMGTVYACKHVVVGKEFAMKVLRSGIERSEEILQRFIREAQAANAVQSRHICEMTDFGQLPNGAFYVVMELLVGGSLTRALRDKRLSRKDMKHVFVQICETLFKAHNANIVHRDMKPDNVMLVEDDGDPNFVKLVDFGIAKITQAEASNLTETGVILGTPYYMSPEQARGDTLDHRSDIYAVGVMMYRAFTGRLPFVADTAMGVLTRHLTEKPELPSRITDIDPQLEHLILKCLEKAPEDRFQTMQQVAHALRSITDDPRPAPASTREDQITGKQAAKPPIGAAPGVASSPYGQQPSSPHVPAAMPIPNPPTGVHVPGAPGSAPGSAPGYPQHAAPDPRTPMGSGHPASITGPHSAPGYGSGTHAMGPVDTGSMRAHGPVSGGSAAPGSEPHLPAHLYGEAATNRGVSARIDPAPPPQKRWPLVAGMAFFALLAVGAGAFAITRGGTEGTGSQAAPPQPTAQETADAPEPTAAPKPSEDPVATAPSASASASGDEAPKPRPVAGPRPGTTPRPGPAPRPTSKPDPEPDVKPTPKPVDDVRDPFDE